MNFRLISSRALRLVCGKMPFRNVMHRFLLPGTAPYTAPHTAVKAETCSAVQTPSDSTVLRIPG